jgi:hypothetical protein
MPSPNNPNFICAELYTGIQRMDRKYLGPLLTAIVGGIIVAVLSPLGTMIWEAILPSLSTVHRKLFHGNDPIKGVNVVLDSDKKDLTDDGGVFLFKNVPSSDHQFLVTKGDNALIYSTRVIVDKHERSKDLGIISVSCCVIPSAISDPHALNDLFKPEKYSDQE